MEAKFKIGDKVRITDGVRRRATGVVESCKLHSSRLTKNKEKTWKYLLKPVNDAAGDSARWYFEHELKHEIVN